MSTAKKFTLGLVQLKCDPEPRHNLEHAVERIGEAARRGADVICLPELFLSHYFCQRTDLAIFDLAETIPGPTTERLCSLAKSLGKVIVASLFERRAAGLFHNTAAVIDADGALVGVYRKMHIPDDPLYHEKYYFTPGEIYQHDEARPPSGFRVFKTRYATLGVLICWDQWYPEAARITALMGAEILLYPTAIGWHPREKEEWGAAQADAWRTIQRSHAIANGVYVAAANRVGHEDEPHTDGITFFGHSFVADPAGRVIASAGEEPAILIAKCDPLFVETTRRAWPFLRDRRIDAYGPILRRYLGA